MSKSVKMILFSVAGSFNALTVSYICSWESTTLAPLLLVAVASLMLLAASRQMQREHNED